jgi:hypothetical protein
VAVRDSTDHAWPWRLRAAIQTELVAQLRSRGVDATDGELDPKSVWLSQETRRFSQPDVLRWKRDAVAECLLFGQLQREGNSLLLRLMVLRRDSPRPVAVQSVHLAANDVALARNIPELSQNLIQYLRPRVGTTIGDGQCWTAAVEALKQAGGKRLGIYILGRELAQHEALIPGDILQLEQARFLSGDGKRRASMPHHTAVVDEVAQPDVVRILHQNFGSAGKKLSALTLHLDELRSGTLIAYRPANDSTSLPWRIPPRRRGPAQVPRDGTGRIDVLKTLDPALDSVWGIWHCWEGPLTVHRERYARLQIPVDVPPSYVLAAEVTRQGGDGSFGFGLVVGGRQVLLVFDAYGGDVSGLHRLDGKRANANASTRKGVLLPANTKVQLQVHVTPKTIRASVDGKLALEWSGDPARLSLDPAWEVPRKDWLFLASFETKVLITSLTLTPSPRD